MDRPALIELPKISDPRGNLTFIENNQHIPFKVRRVYYLYDVPTDAERGAHAHKELHQVIIPLAGSFLVTLDNGTKRIDYYLKKPWEGLYIPRMHWRELKEFSSGAVCLVLASDFYSEEDYFRDYASFLKEARVS